MHMFGLSASSVSCAFFIEITSGLNSVSLSSDRSSTFQVAEFNALKTCFKVNETSGAVKLTLVCL